MKKLVFAASVFSIGLALVGCGGASGNDPGRAYMPDMYYARAYEAYGYNMVEGEHDSLRSRGIFYNGLPVPGTVARGEMLPNHLTADTVGLKASNALANPIAGARNPQQIKEGERLYLVNCGICHGTALDGNGPLYKGGDGPYPAKPQVLNDAQAAGWTDGHYYHVITFGKGQMGSYASQLTPQQRWLVINYIRSKQSGASSDTVATEAQTPLNQTAQPAGATAPETSNRN